MSIEQPDQGISKKVDEGWKAQAQKEKGAQPEPSPVKPPPRPTGQGQARPSQQAPQAPGQADFSFFLSSLSMQALMCLGELPHPSTNQVHEDLEQARTLIDVLGMLQEKTKGNLTSQEQSLLEELLYELRLKYVEKTRSPS